MNEKNKNMIYIIPVFNSRQKYFCYINIIRGTDCGVAQHQSIPVPCTLLLYCYNVDYKPNSES